MRKHKKLLTPGQRFGMLVIEKLCSTRYIAPNGHTRRQYLCICDCGNRTIVNSHALGMGNRLSCGCMRRAKPKPPPCPKRIKPYFCKEAQKSYYRLCNIWRLMKCRCLDEKHSNFKNYGGRNICICENWLNNRDAFIFWAITHGYEDDKSIDRINNDWGYYPENCRWVTRDIQSNNKRCSHFIEYEGERMTVRQWEKRLGLSRGAIIWRLSHGWTPKQAIEGR